MDVRCLRRIERGRENMTLAVFVELAEGLGVDPGRLLKPAILEPSRPGTLA